MIDVDPPKTKICNTCFTEQAFHNFYKGAKRSWDGRSHQCKSCGRRGSSKRYHENPKKYLEANKIWAQNNHAQAMKTQKEWRARNPLKVKGYESKRYRKNPRKRILASDASKKKRRDRDPVFRLESNLRCRVRNGLRGRAKKSASTEKLLGCTVEYLKAWLEFWMQPGMTWENYGEWHVDHKRPCASFDLGDPEQQRQCFNYRNLQPLWAGENLSKGAKYNG